MELAELSVEDISRLARRFLAGDADAGVLSQVKLAVEEDPQMALELLTQMQEALDQLPPYGFTPEQWAEVDKRVAALFIPGPGGKKAKGPGLLSSLLGLFKSKPKAPKEEKEKAAQETPALIRRKGATIATSTQAPLPQAEDEMVPVVEEQKAGIEEEKRKEEKAAEAAPVKKAAASQKAIPVKRLLGVVLLLGLAGAGWYFRAALFSQFQSFKDKWSAPPTPIPTAVPTPAGIAWPTATPTLTLTPGAYIPRRGVAGDVGDDLPSDIKQVTPQAAGLLGPVDIFNDHDPETGEKLPLPSY